MAATVNYHCFEEQYSMFFSPALLKIISEFSKSLSHQDTLHVYPDASMKSVGLPNGLGLVSPEKNALLFPGILRDPGCGFLLFKLKFSKKLPSKWEIQLGQVIKNYVEMTDFVKRRTYKYINLSQILHHGLHYLRADNCELVKFTDRSFTVDTNLIKLTNEEQTALEDDFMSVTNTIELKKTKLVKDSLCTQDSLKNNEVIGFIHSGSDVFPKILSEKFYRKIADYSFFHKLFTLNEIRKGIFAVPLDSQLGNEYYQWLRAAMNYSLVNRYTIFYHLKETIESALPCSITLLNDTIHAGLFSETKDGTRLIKSIRGVQEMKHPYCLIAGQRETLSALVSPSFRSEENMICHGIGDYINNNIDYQKVISTKENKFYIQLANNVFYNTHPNYKKCGIYNHHLTCEIDYFSSTGLAKLVAWLKPCINIQSPSLQKRLRGAHEKLMQ